MQLVLRLLLCTASMVIGVTSIVISILPETGAELIDTYQQRLQEPGGRVASGLLGAVLALIPLAMLLRWYASRRYAREISYATEAGRVAVSLIAIEEALTRAVEQEPVVRKVQIRVYEDRVRRAIVIEAALTLWDDGDVSGVNRRCQHLMRERFGELMPDETAVQVHLTVHRLSHRRNDDEPRERHPRERSTRETETLRRQSEAEDRTPLRVPLPGLTATHGGVDNLAGAELLRSRRESRGAAGERVPAENQAPEPQPAEAAPEVDEDEDYDDLYVGPSYPVDDDEDDSGSQKR
jgi:hypothetical protein